MYRRYIGHGIGIEAGIIRSSSGLVLVCSCMGQSHRPRLHSRVTVKAALPHAYANDRNRVLTTCTTSCQLTVLNLPRRQGRLPQQSPDGLATRKAEPVPHRW